MTSHYTALLTRVQEIHDLQKASALLSWDRQVIMPQAGDDVRVKQITTLQRLTHAMFTDDEMGELIERAAEEIEGTLLFWLLSNIRHGKSLRRPAFRRCPRAAAGDFLRTRARSNRYSPVVAISEHSPARAEISAYQAN